MTLKTDNFTGTDGQLLTARTDWSQRGGGTCRATVNASNQIKSVAGGDASTVCVDTGANDMYAQCVALSDFGTDDGLPLVLRVTDRNSYVGARFNSTTSLWEIFTQFGRVTSAAGSFTSGDVIRFEIVGDVATIKKNGSTVLTDTVPSITASNYAGIFLRIAKDPVMDDWESNSIGGADTTAPTLTSPTATTTGSTTATGSVTTDEANGTLYRLASTNATETAATVIAAALSQTVTATGAQAVSFTGLTASTTYYAHYVHVDAAANQSTRVSSSSFTTTTPDTTAPTLSSGVGTVKSNALIVVGATTNEANGTMYVVVTTSATPPSAAQVKLGQNNGGTAAVFAANQAIGSTGAKTFNATGLTQLTGYYPYIVHTDAAGNDSSVLSIGLRTTFKDGATGQSIVDNTAAIPGVQEQGILYNDVSLPADADKWFSYDVVTPVVDTASLTLFANGALIWTGGSDSFTYQLKVDGSNVGTPALVTLTASGADTTAPTLSSATGTKTGSTTATGTVTTNEGNGTLYYLTNTSSSALSAAVLAGSSQAVTTTGVQNISRTGLTASTTYYHHYLHKDAAGNDSTVLSSSGFTTDPPPDVTAPTLSSPTGTKTGSTTATGTVSTNESGGTLYHLVNTSASATGAAVKAGASQAVSTSGVQNVSRTGLTPSTVYYLHYLHSDAAGNDSTVASSASFTTDAAADTTAPTLTSPTGAALGPTGSSGSVSTNEANGTLYWLTNTSATATDAAIKAASSQAVTATGVQLVSSSGLTASTVYYNHFLHRDAAGNDSTRSTSASFTTDAPGAPATGSDHGGEAMRSCMRPAMYPAMNKG